METYYRYDWATKCTNNTTRHYLSKKYNDRTIAEIMFHKVCFKDKTESGILFEVKKLGENKKHYEIIETYYKIG